METILKDHKGRKYKVGSLVRVSITIDGIPLKPFRGYVKRITNKYIVINPLNQDFFRYVSPDNITVLKFN